MNIKVKVSLDIIKYPHTVLLELIKLSDISVDVIKCYNLLF